MSVVLRVPAAPRGRLPLLAGSAALAGAAVPVLGPERVLLLGVAGALALFLTYRPHWGVLALSALWIFQLNPVRIGPLDSPELLLGVLLVPLVVRVVRDRSVRILEVPQFLILLAIGLVLLMATAWAELMYRPPDVESLTRTSAELRAFRTGLVYVVLFLYFIRTPRHVRLVMGFLAVVIAVAVLDAFDIIGPAPSGERLHASQGFAGNSNRLALLAVWGTAIFWMLREHGAGRWWRRLTVIPLLALPVTVLMTASRNGLLQLLLLAGLILMGQRGWSPGQRARSVALIATAGILAVALAPSAVILRATSFEATARAPGGESLRHRSEGVAAGIEMALEHPVFGVGPGNFRRHTGTDLGPHNAYLWALTAGGPLLLLLYVLLFWSSLRAVRAAERRGPPELLWASRATRCNLIVFLAFSLFADTWLQHPTFLLVALAAALGRLARPAPHPALAVR
ncbi:MAG TPA: O-antigen ligase family protein [Candidatus Tectomicrobia bacterium]|nr:O-antigen ligase family protein [Candidatus Tectomicrobia bacterium]